jgi:hypothetical protein
MLSSPKHVSAVVLLPEPTPVVRTNMSSVRYKSQFGADGKLMTDRCSHPTT